MNKQIAPYFSIITPTWNIATYLPRMLRSVSEQKFRNFEHIFVDAFSTDGTYELIQQYKESNPDISVIIIQSPPKGVFDGFNKGLDNASGTFVNYLNGDDYFFDDEVLSTVYHVTKKRNEIRWLQGDTVLHKKSHLHIRNRYHIKHLFHFMISFMCPISHQSTFMTRELLLQYGKFKTHRRVGMDTDLFLRVSRNETIYFLDRKLSVFGVRKGAVSQQSPLKTGWANWKDFAKSYGHIPFFSGIVDSFSKRSKRVLIIPD